MTLADPLASLVDIRWLAVPDGPADAGLKCLDEEECRKRERFVFDRDRRLYTVAHALLRDTLSERGSLPPAAWRFTTDINGKPRLADDGVESGLTFNLSHCRGLVACAVAMQREIGIDVETPGCAVAVDDLAGSVLSPQELAVLDAADDRTATFLAFWTLREAYVKARGLGLFLPFDRYRVALDPPRIFAAADDPVAWTARLYRPAGGVMAFVGAGDPHIRCRRATPAWFT